jgi:prolipoprotein diacylglyceryltransferase
MILVALFRTPLFFYGLVGLGILLWLIWKKFIKKKVIHTEGLVDAVYLTFKVSSMQVDQFDFFQ